MTNLILRKILSSLLICGSSLLVPNHLCAQTPASPTRTITTFTDVTTAAGFSGCPTCQLNSSWALAWADYDGDAHSAVWADFDNDGLLDLFIGKGTIKTNPVNYDDLWHHNSDGTFTNIAHSAGVESLGHRHRGGGAVDYDNDSYLDIFALAYHRPQGGLPNTLYHNNGDLTFTDVAALAGLDRPNIENRTAAWSDFDGDGLLDVFITRVDGLYKNNGDGTFTDVTVAAGIVDAAEEAQAAAWGDYDNDGHPDLYITFGPTSAVQDLAEILLTPETQSPTRTPLVVQTPNILYHNNGDGTFTDVTAQSGAVNTAGALGVTWVDYDNDGNLDLYIVNSTPGN